VKHNFFLTHVMKAHVKNGGRAPLILNLSIRWKLWWTSRPGRLTPRKNTGTHWIEDLDGKEEQGRSERWEEHKSIPYQDSNPFRSGRRIGKASILNAIKNCVLLGKGRRGCSCSTCMPRSALIHHIEAAKR